MQHRVVPWKRSEVSQKHCLYLQDRKISQARNQQAERVICLKLVPCLAYSSVLKKAASFSETSDYFQRTTWHYIPENINIHNHCCEDLRFNCFNYNPYSADRNGQNRHTVNIVRQLEQGAALLSNLSKAAYIMVRLALACSDIQQHRSCSEAWLPVATSHQKQDSGNWRWCDILLTTITLHFSMFEFITITAFHKLVLIPISSERRSLLAKLLSSRDLGYPSLVGSASVCTALHFHSL
jgi:hypothetical protein